MLIIFDMDGTIFSHKSIWTELDCKLGTTNQTKDAVDMYLQTDYPKLVELVIGSYWKGKPAQPFLDLIKQAQYLPGVKETIGKLHQRGYTTAIISSGPQQLVDRAMRELNINYGIGNMLDIKDGIITGKYEHADGTTMWPVHDNNKDLHARELSKHIGISLENTLAIGDSKNDIPLFKTVNTSFAFNTEDEELIRVATYHISTNDFGELLHYL